MNKIQEHTEVLNYVTGELETLERMVDSVNLTTPNAEVADATKRTKKLLLEAIAELQAVSEVPW